MLFFPIEQIQAQKERSNWYFGTLAGMQYSETGYSSLDNNSITRNIVLGQIEGPDNIICASDEDGNLMFYSDGRVFKNREHQKMPNSPTREYAFWESQTAIARDPADPNKYYVFVTIQDQLKTKLTYTVVDMSMDNGLGGLDANQTHVILTTNVGQHMATARHANGKDIWLLCIRNGSYLAYLITENGISRNPVSSQEGLSFFDRNPALYGAMEVSPDNKLIAAGFPNLGKLFLLEFNDLTGKLELIYEEEEPSQDPELGPYTGVEFTPNSQVLYTTYMSSGIQQYDLSDLENIPPRVSITSDISTYPYLKRGPDGQIFSIQKGKSYIGAIQNPDVVGLSCNYVENVLNLSGSNLLDLPTFLMPKYPDGISLINICEGEATEFNYKVPYGTPILKWNFGDGNSGAGENVSHTYNSPGQYTVSVEVYNGFTNALLYTETQDITIYERAEIPEIDDQYICSNDNPIFFSENNSYVLNGLDPNIFDVSYFYSEKEAILNENEVSDFTPEVGSKTVWVKVANSFNPTCYDIKSFTINTPEFLSIDIPSQQYLCAKNTLTLEAPDGYLSYEWSTGETSQDIIVTSTGRYTITVVKDFGNFTCQTQKTISVGGPSPAPIIKEIQVNDWSLEHNSIEIITEEKGNYEYSVDGITYQTAPQFFNLPIDEYTAYVRDATCLNQVQSVPIFLLYYDKFFTPNDDGYNDDWQITNSEAEEDIQILIMDRYGQIITELQGHEKGWDGKLNGEPLPTSDYWFQVKRSNGEIHFGHFTLKR
ncbi:MAG: T9SS type B sorting domain-containing protein [Flavobacteriaceae bacterium]|nr:T9SS type B sorting domain-containing protein [Flavobacteriaceae bacterium]